MTSLYREICQEMSNKIDSALEAKMQAENQKELKALDEIISDAEKNLGAFLYVCQVRCESTNDVQVRVKCAMRSTRRQNTTVRLATRSQRSPGSGVSSSVAHSIDADFSLRSKACDKTVGMGNRIDLVLQLIRVGFFYNDYELIRTNMTKVKELMDEVSAA